MQIMFFGPNSSFFRDAFFNPADGSLDIGIVSASATEVVLSQPTTGVVTTLTGTGFAVSGDAPTAGTVTAASFVQNGTTLATFSDIAWSLVAFAAALDALDTSSDFAPLGALFSASGPITIDAGLAPFFDMDDFEQLSPFLTTPVLLTGSNGSDELIGGVGNDSVDPGTSDGYDRIHATPGDDAYDFGAADDTSYYEIEYDYVNGPVTVTGNTGADTFTVASPGEGTDTLSNVQGALTSTGGGLGIIGSSQGDVFDITYVPGTWMPLSGGSGDDVFALTMEEGAFVRIFYNWDGVNGPATGIAADLAAGTITDGLGGTDTLEITGTGAVEIRGTDFVDTFSGSNRDDFFITEQGNDSVDGGLGFDSVRYDRAGVGPMNIDLAAGTASGTWDGNAFTDSLTSVEYIRGSAVDDTIAGSDAAERLYGSEGDDSILGRDGDDRLEGGNGDDTLQGGAGDDIIFDGSGADLVQGGGGDDTFVNGGGAGDRFEGGTGSDTLLTDVSNESSEDVVVFNAVTGVHGRLGSTQGQDSIDGVENYTFIGSWDVLATGDDADNELRSDTGDDTLIGGAGRDRLYSGAGDDSIDASGGSADSQGFGDYVRPGLGTDVVQGHAGLWAEGGGITVGYGDLSVGVTATLTEDGSGTVTGTGINDSFTFANFLEGSQGGDVLTGSDADRFEGFAGLGGDDTIAGGAGFDQLTYAFELEYFDGQGSGVTVDMAAGTATDTQGGTDTFSGINEVVGSQVADSLSAAGLSTGVSLRGEDGNDTLTGGAGDDTLQGGDGSDTAVIALALADVVATEGDNGWITVASSLGTDTYEEVEFFQFTDTTVSAIVLLGGEDPAGQTLIGTDGPDTLTGTGDDDTISGGAGGDDLSGGDGNDLISGSTGDDVVDGGAGNDTIGGGPGADSIAGGVGNDVIGAGQDNDVADGGDGNDIVNGGPGDDTLLGGDGNDTMGASFGNDSVEGQGGDDSLGGGTGRDTLDGGAGSDALGGGEGDDVVMGGAGDDFVAGGGRNDVVDGGAGDDRINGGDGDDTMTGGTGADVFIYNFFKDGDADVITDFEDGIDSFRMVGVENAPGTGLQGKLEALNITDTAQGALIDYQGHTVLIEGVSAADLGLDDFTFL